MRPSRLLGSALSAAILSMAIGPTAAQECPQGYRFHYQGFCINKADELADDQTKPVRTVPPITTAKPGSTDGFKALERTGYKFSNMKDGEYCKNAFVRISRSSVPYPVAFALGDQSCGFGDVDIASIEAARARAMAECEKHTHSCRIIFPEGE